SQLPIPGHSKNKIFKNSIKAKFISVFSNFKKNKHYIYNRLKQGRVKTSIACQKYLQQLQNDITTMYNQPVSSSIITAIMTGLLSISSTLVSGICGEKEKNITP
ncbi:hypothetical protein, partial [Calothrix sp. UHCC 0171]|uniref:hypothetical protein n=1 Tax=Calothrix sp. UHCC 0171 TaxID=3110245 RepID=UPI002B1FC301